MTVRRTVSEVAGDLVQALQSEVKAVDQGVMNADTLAELKHIHGMNKKLVAASLVANTEILALKAQIVVIKAEITSGNNTQRLQWALSNSSVGAFTYVTGPILNNPTAQTSEDRIVKTLKNFMTNNGSFIGETFACVSARRLATFRTLYGGELTLTEEEKKLYRTSLSEQIHTLTGVKPRLAKEKDGRWAIWQK